jgi:hypothetical protein
VGVEIRGWKLRREMEVETRGGSGEWRLGLKVEIIG